MGKKALTTEFVRRKFEEAGYTLSDDFKYINSKTKINFVCENGHKHATTWNNFQKGHRCGKCVRDNTKLSTKFIRSKFEEAGYKLSDDFRYINNHSKIDFVCPKGHNHAIDWHSFKKGVRCGKCYAINKFGMPTAFQINN